MKKKQAKMLFEKYVNEQCTDREKELLNQYLESFQDKKLAIEELQYFDEVENKIWLNILSESQKANKVIKFPLRKYFGYVAVFVTMMCLSYYLLLNNNEPVQELKIASTEQPIILKTGDDKKVVIDTNGKQAIYKDGALIGEQNGASINYKNNKVIKELVFNEIDIPHGRTFKLTLSDGTHVHLNAGSKLKYPVAFIRGKQREVYLSGEAYFEVAKDEKHPFIVESENMGVKVLGTHFNVNTYDEANPYTVLAEGSVRVYSQHLKGESKFQKTIVPGQKAQLTERIMEVEEVDVDKYISWREGRLLFNNETFIKIIEKIERKYNITIQNEYLELNNLKFKGSFKDETITDLLDTFKESAGFNYSIQNNQIIINKP